MALKTMITGLFFTVNDTKQTHSEPQRKDDTTRRVMAPTEERILSLVCHFVLFIHLFI